MKNDGYEATTVSSLVEPSSGDRLLLFTGGLTEAVDQDREQFGEQRLIELLCNHRARSADELKEILFEAAGESCGNIFRDDAALLVVGID